MKNLIHYILGLVLASLLVNTSGFSQTNEELEAMRQEFEDYKQQERENFREFVEKRDQEFAAYLKAEMRNIELMKSRSQGKIPGPDKIPTFRPEKQQVESQPIPVMEIRETDIPQTEHLPGLQANKVPRVRLPETIEVPIPTSLKTAEFDFYGSKQQFFYDPDIHQNPGSKNGPELISAYFETLSKTDYFPLTQALIEAHNKYNLNDWAYLKLCEKLAENIAVTDREKNLLHWFLLIKTGYKAKIAYQSDNISLMIPSQQEIYGLPYYSFNGEDYYILNPELTRIQTYNTDYPGADSRFDLNMYQAPVLPQKLGTRKLKNGSEDYVRVAYNQNLKALYDEFPQADMELFFHSSLSPLARESLHFYFDPSFQDKSDKEIVADLLKFVQNRFDYLTDQEQFGREKFFFPDECFMYPSADCEDRSVLFSWLVREFTDLDVIGLDYPGHISTAVAFEGKTRGHHLQYKDKIYTICDPTYIGAPIGACMPDFQDKKAAVIEISTAADQNNIEEEIWAKLYEAGGFRNNSQQVSATDPMGNMYFCGSFDKKMSIEDHALRSDGKRTGFVAAFTREGELINAISLDHAPLVTPENILINEGNIFVSGTERHKNNKKLFVIKLNKALEPRWLKDYLQENGQAVNWQLMADGTEASRFNINPAEIRENAALRINKEGKIELMARNEAPVYSKMKAASLSPYEKARLWKSKSEEYKKQSYHPSVSGILAFLNTVQKSGYSVTGREIVASLNAFNPEFSTKHASLNQNLKKIDSIYCEDNIMTIRIKDKSTIALGPLLIEDNSKIRLYNYYSGNLKMFFSNGASYKSLFKTHPVYSLKIYKSNGDMILEYNTNHDKRLLSAGGDIIK